MSKKKLLLSTIIGTGLMLFASKTTLASEGKIIMRNVIGGSSHCFAGSVFLPADSNYNIFITCRNLIYPVTPEIFKYVVWSTPSNGDNPIKLGELGFGKVHFKTDTAFSSIFVTQEKDGNVRTPTGTTVMRGSVGPFTELEDASNDPQPQDEPEVLASPTPAPARSNVLSFLRSGAVLTVISIFVILLMLILVKPFK